MTGYGLLINSVSDLSFVRFLNIIQLSLCAFFLTWWLKRYFFDYLPSVFISIAIFTLPAFEIMTSWVAAGFNLAVFFALLAAITAYEIPTQGPWLKRFSHFYSLLTFFFLFCALCIHQSAATFYWAMAATVVLFSPIAHYDPLKKKITNFFFIGVLTALFYRIFIMLMSPYTMKFKFYFYNPDQITTDYLNKLSWFIREPLANSLNLWNIFPIRHFSLVLSICIMVVMLFSFLKVITSSKNKTQVVKKLLFLAVITGVLTLLSFSPNLILKGNFFAAHRTSVGLTTIIAFLIIWAIQKLGRRFLLGKMPIFTIVLFLICLYGAQRALKNVLYYRVLPSYLELRYVKDKIYEALLNNYNEVHFLVPDSASPKYIYDEFVILTTAWPNNVIPLTLCCIRELIKEQDLKLISLKFDTATQTFNLVLGRLESKTHFRHEEFKLKISQGTQNVKKNAGVLLINTRDLANNLN